MQTNPLSNIQCEPCTKESPPLTTQEAERLLTSLPGWRIEQVNDTNRLTRTFKFKGFKEALAFTNRVGEIAEEQDHHPELLTEWGKVTVTWWTHSIRGLHKNDFIMALKTEGCEEE